MGYNYTRAFDPFSYSSGEGTRQFSDSQTVDYGFPVEESAGIVNDVFNIDPIVSNAKLSEGSDAVVNFGRTPEYCTSYFGNVPYPFSGDGAATFQGPKTARLNRRRVGGMDTLSARMAAPVSGGASSIKFSQDAHTAVTPPIEADEAKSSLALQNESKLNRVFNGQLGEDKTFATTNSSLVIGVGLLIAAFFV